MSNPVTESNEQELSLICLKCTVEPMYEVEEEGNNFVGRIKVGDIEIEGGSKSWTSKRLAREWLARRAVPELVLCSQSGSLNYLLLI